MEDNLFLKILEYAWIVVLAMLTWVMKKLSLHDTSIKLLEQARINDKEKRDEDVTNNNTAHANIISAMGDNHTTVMGRLDILAGKHKE